MLTFFQSNDFTFSTFAHALVPNSVKLSKSNIESWEWSINDLIFANYSALKKLCKTSFMYKQILGEHKNQPHGVEFEWGIVGKFVKPLERQLSEALCIEETPMHEGLNSRKEYFHHNVKRIGLTDDQRSEQCDYCSRKFETITDLEKHEKLVHIRYKCQHCDYLSFGDRDLKYHTDESHC